MSPDSQKIRPDTPHSSPPVSRRPFKLIKFQVRPIIILMDPFPLGSQVASSSSGQNRHSERVHPWELSCSSRGALKMSTLEISSSCPVQQLFKSFSIHTCGQKERVAFVAPRGGGQSCSNHHWRPRSPDWTRRKSRGNNINSSASITVN